MYYYLNLNPYNKRTGDCVIRATALALDTDWHTASDLLYKQARSCGCEMSCLGCYSALFRRMGFEQIEFYFSATVDEVLQQHKDSVMLIRIKGHLTCGKYGKLYDIWDCSQEMVDCAWIVE